MLNLNKKPSHWWFTATTVLAFLVGGGLSGCLPFEPPLGSEGGTSDLSSTELDTGPDDKCPGNIRINEVDGATTGSGFDREFIEIVNAADVAQNVGGLHIARRRGSGPDSGKAVSIPDSLVLQPGAFLYLVANLQDPKEGLQPSDCIDGAPTPCLHAGWDISATGDTAYLLNRGKTEILCEFEYLGMVSPGDAWGRVPDGASNLAATRPTPGASNEASGS